MFKRTGVIKLRLISYFPLGGGEVEWEGMGAQVFETIELKLSPAFCVKNERNNEFYIQSSDTQTLVLY